MKIRPMCVFIASFSIGVGITQIVVAEDVALDKLPEPLTLEHALVLADQNHPDLSIQQANLAEAKAVQKKVNAVTGVNASLNARLRIVEPPEIATDQSRQDHSVGLSIHKRLYDFGHTAALSLAAADDVSGQEWLYKETLNSRRIFIMQRFFEVLLSDLEYTRDNESMALAFVGLDRKRHRHALGQVSDLTLSEAESEYQNFRRRRYASQARQRATRAALAIAFNRPHQLSSDLLEPVLVDNGRSVPPLEELTDKVLRDNPGLIAMRAQLNAAQARLKAARASDNPVVNVELEAFAHSREIGSRDPFRAGVTFEVPLTTGGRTQAIIDRRQAELQRLRAELAAKQLATRQAVLDTWLEIQTLHVQRDEVGALSTFRDLNLDRSRILYDMEFTADLGDAMAKQSESRLLTAATEYKLALAWARLDAMAGVKPYNPKQFSRQQNP